ncbi:MAG: UrcA family protein [Pseudomonadota bacterium]
MTLSKSLISFTVATAALSFLPAMAAGKDTIKQKAEISLAGYDLTDVADAKAVVEKIQTAAEKVCSLPGGEWTLRERMDKRSCEAEAIERAVQSLDSSIVTAVLEDRSRF